MKTYARSSHVATGLVLAAALLGDARAAQTIEARELALASTLRCMVCQNQTLAESNAPLAQDMRRQIREQLARGRSENEVRNYFEERYGAFVRYDPPFAPSTWLLWLTPFALLVSGFWLLRRTIRRRAAGAPTALTASERARADALLEAQDP